MSSHPGLGQCRVEWARADVEPSGLGLMSIRPGLGQCRVEQSWADVEPSGPRSMSSRVGLRPMSSWASPGQCRAERGRAERFRADVEFLGSGPMSSRRAWVDVESFESRLMSSRLDPGYRVVWVRADVEPFGPGPISSRVGPRLVWVGLGLVRVKLVCVHIKIDLM